MSLDFGENNNTSDNTNVKDCIKQLLFAAGGDPSKLTQLITESIQGINISDQLGGVAGSAIGSVTRNVNQIASNLQKFREGLPLSEILPSSTLRPPINIVKSLSDVVNDLQTRCVDFLLAALDQISPLERLEQLLNLIQDLCSQLNFTYMRKVIDKIEQTQRDIITELVDKITNPLEKVAKLNDMLVDAINTGSQEMIDRINDKLDEIGFSQLYDYIYALDPQEALGRLQAEIKKRTQLGDVKGVRDMLNAISALEASLQDKIDSVADVLSFTGNVFDIPANIISEAQKKIDEALDLGNYEEINNVVNAFDNIQNELLSNLQNLDPQTLLQKGVTLLNEALQKADIGRYNRILDEMAQKLCSQQTLGALPSLPNVPQLQLPSLLA